MESYISKITKWRWKESLVSPQDVLSFEENAEALIHRGLILSSVGLTLLQRLNGAKLPRQSLKQGFPDMEGLKHPLVDWSQLPVDLNLLKAGKKTGSISKLLFSLCLLAHTLYVVKNEKESVKELRTLEYKMEKWHLDIKKKKTHRPAFVQQKDQMQKVDRKKDNIPNHHIQVASVKGRPSNHETASWQRQGKDNLRVQSSHKIKLSISKQSKSGSLIPASFQFLCILVYGFTTCPGGQWVNDLSNKPNSSLSPKKKKKSRYILSPLEAQAKDKHAGSSGGSNSTLGSEAQLKGSSWEKRSFTSWWCHRKIE